MALSDWHPCMFCGFYYTLGSIPQGNQRRSLFVCLTIDQIAWNGCSNLFIILNVAFQNI